jgi:hypothetical protein
MFPNSLLVFSLAACQECDASEFDFEESAPCLISTLLLVQFSVMLHG